MTEEEFMDIIDYEATIYKRWETHNGDFEYLEEAISNAFSNIKEAAIEYFSQNGKK